MESETVEAAMLATARYACRIHRNDRFEGVYWVESRYSRRGWWSILWRWPRLEGGLFIRSTGTTLPVFCKTRDEAIGWAWTLAEQQNSLKVPANMA